MGALHCCKISLAEDFEMANKTRKAVFIVLVLIILTLAAFANHTMGYSNPTTTPTTDPIDQARLFPTTLGCSYIETVAEGPSWESITVGQTTFEELDALFHELNPNYVQSGNIEPKSYQWMLETKPPWTYPDLGIEQAPSAVQVCIVDGTVAAIRLSPPSLRARQLYLRDFLALYAIPDVITWGTIDISDRVAFWFEDGMAVNFPIGEAFFNEDVPARIGSVTYFPYQEVEGYENRWPFNRTKEQPFPNIRGLTPQPLNLMGTITALEMAPPRTPTPTFTLWPTPTATPEPTRVSN
jgi:hypothetical protein